MRASPPSSKVCTSYAIHTCYHVGEWLRKYPCPGQLQPSPGHRAVSRTDEGWNDMKMKRRCKCRGGITRDGDRALILVAQCYPYMRERLVSQAEKPQDKQRSGQIAMAASPNHTISHSSRVVTPGRPRASTPPGIGTASVKLVPPELDTHQTITDRARARRQAGNCASGNGLGLCHCGKLAGRL